MKRIYIMLAAAASFSLFANDQRANVCSNASLRYWVDASFTYWFSKEDGLNVAESGQVDLAATTVFANSPKVFQQEFGYHPGFKVGMGLFAINDWQVYGEYTYYRGTNRVSRDAPAGTVGVGVWSLDSWYLQDTPFSNQSLTGTSLQSTWKLGMDMGDLLFSSPFSKKRGFVYAPFGGLRTVWIRQQMNLALTETGASFGGDNFLASQPVESRNQSHAWGLGPRIGVDGRYNLSSGFTLDAEIGASLFFTRFTNVRHSEGQAAIFYETPIPVRMDYTCVRPEVDLSLGFGWQKEISDKQGLDLMASYDFTYFWGQNMMRSLMDEYVAGISSGSLDLYFFGVTLQAGYRF